MTATPSVYVSPPSLSLPGDHAADVDYEGDTALNRAVYKDYYEITDLLLKDGRCDPTVVDRFNNAAIRCAVDDTYNDRITDLLLSHTRVVKALRKEDIVPPAVQFKVVLKFILLCISVKKKSLLRNTYHSKEL